MLDHEEFKHMKKEMIEKNDHQYGREVEEKWGKEIYHKSQQKVSKMSKEDLDDANKLEREIIQLLVEGYALSNPASKPAQDACERHKKWLMHFWPSYSKQAHLALVDMYVQDERFKVYYDQHQDGLALFLNKSMHIYLGTENI